MPLGSFLRLLLWCGLLCCAQARRSFRSSAGAAPERVNGGATKGMKVVLIGAAGGIGQPLALLLKQNVRVRSLALVDVLPTRGVAADLSHINTPAAVTAHDVLDEESRKTALAGADIVVITAGKARGPGMTREDLFKANAKILSDLAESCARLCPSAFICVVTNPVNAMVPLVKSVMEREGVYDSRKLFGITTLDLVRASTFVTDAKGTVDSGFEEVPVIGGHSGTTIVPLLSQVSELQLDSASQAKLVNRIQFAGDEVVEAKEGAGSATLSMAYSAAHFVGKLLDARCRISDVVATAFVECDLGSRLWEAIGGEPDAIECPFFATEFRLSHDGVSACKDVEEYVSSISDDEKTMIREMLPNLARTEAQGLSYAMPGNHREGTGKL